MVGYALVDDEPVVRLTLVNAQVGDDELRFLFESLCEVADELREVDVAVDASVELAAT
jgi:hypothetical protein